MQLAYEQPLRITISHFHLTSTFVYVLEKLRFGLSTCLQELFFPVKISLHHHFLGLDHFSRLPLVFQP